MPGLICHLRNPTTVEPPPVCLTGVEPATKVVSVSGRASSLLIGCVPRPGEPVDDYFHRDDELVLAYYGHCHRDDQRGFLDASALHALVKADGPQVVDKLDGSFVLAFYRADSDTFWFCSDRVGALPMFWQRGLRSFTIGHRLDQLPVPPSPEDIDPAGLVTYLTNGYCLDETTLFKSTKIVRPAACMQFELGRMRVTSERYWDLAYRPDDRAAKSELMSRINDAIVASVGALSPADSPAGVFLSGGWDSRGLVAGFLGAGTRPTVAVAQGMTDELPGSDAAVAKTIAARYDIPFRFYRRRPENTLRHFRDGILRSELITDSTPDIFGQHLFQPELFDGIDGIFKGHDCWGLGELASSRDDVLLTFGLPVAVPAPVQDLLTDAVNADAQQLYDTQLDRVLSGCDSPSWNDKKDYFYLRGREARFTFGVDRSDDMTIEVRRPFLSRRILELMTSIPERYRIRKNLYLETLCRHYPHLFLLGRDHRSAITDYYFILSEQVRQIGLARLEAGDDLGGLILPEAARRLLDGFRPQSFEYRTPSWKSRVRDYCEDRCGFLVYRRPWYLKRSAARPSGHPATSTNKVAFRLFLLLDYLHRTGGGT